MTAHSASAVTAAQDIRVAFGRLRRRMQEVATDDDLTPSQASVIVRLSKGEAATAAGLAQLEGIRPQSMAATLVALEQRGLISRTPDPTDGRRQVVTLTAAGAEVEEGNRAARGEWIVGRLDEVCTEQERQLLIRAAAVLDRVADR